MCQFDDDLFRYEMATYGISYYEPTDALFVGERFVKAPKHTDFCLAHDCESQLVSLLYSATGGSMIGVKFSHISYLVGAYSNGFIPNPCPLWYFADLADHSFADPDSIMYDFDIETIERAVQMHREARKLLGNEELPLVVRDHILNDHTYAHVSVN